MKFTGKKIMSWLLTVCMVLSLFTGMATTVSAAPSAWNGTVATEFGSGTGTEADPYIIASGSELAYLAQQVNSGTTTYQNLFVKLSTDIDLNNQSWTPIGNSSTNRFRGTFDGDGYSITGLNVNGAYQYAGLFGYSSCTIKNLTISGTINNTRNASSTYTGGLLAYTAATVNDLVTIINCHANITVTGAVGSIGGLVGQAGRCNINGCSTAGTVTKTDEVDGTVSSYVGGFIGYNGFDITNSYSTCTVTANASYEVYAGGFVGSNTGAFANIKNCFSTGNVTALQTISTAASGKNANAGGFSGGNHSTTGKVFNSYSTGNVICKAEISAGVTGTYAANAGGFTGYAQNAAAVVVENCYATGNVTGTIYGNATATLNANVGGVVGTKGTNAAITNCYWNADATQQKSSTTDTTEPSTIPAQSPKLGIGDNSATNVGGAADSTGSTTGMTSVVMKGGTLLGNLNTNASGITDAAAWSESSSGFPTLNIFGVIYDGSGNTSGSVPTDSGLYRYSGSTTVLGNTGSMTKTNCTFEGWNTKRDGSGTDFTADSTVILTKNVILYAQWTAASSDETRTLYYNTSDGKLHFESVSGAEYSGNYQGDGNTLTLSGVVFKTTAAGALVLPANTTMHLTAGTINKFESTNAGNANPSFGIGRNGPLNITGTGTLYATAGNTSVGGGFSYGFYPLVGVASINIADANVIARGGNSTGMNGISVGIYGIISMSSGTLTAYSGTSNRSIAVFGNNQVNSLYFPGASYNTGEGFGNEAYISLYEFGGLAFTSDVTGINFVDNVQISFGPSISLGTQSAARIYGQAAANVTYSITGTNCASTLAPSIAWTSGSAPTGVTGIAFSGQSATGATLTMNVGANTPAGTYTFTITDSANGNITTTGSMVVAQAKVSSVTNPSNVTNTAYEVRLATTAEAVVNAAALPSTVTVTLDSGGTADVPVSWSTATGYNAKGATYAVTGTLTGNNNIDTDGKSASVSIIVNPVTLTKPTLGNTTVLYDASGSTLATPTDLGTSVLPTSGSALVVGETINYTINWNGGQTIDLTNKTNNSVTFTGVVSYTTPPDWLTLPATDISRVVSVTEKTAATVTATAPTTGLTYGEALGDPSADVAETVADAVYTYSYSGTLSDGLSTTYGPTAGKPTAPGNYSVTATLVSDTHAGVSDPVMFTIEKKQLTWNADGAVTSKSYDGTATASVSTQPTLNGIVSGDTVNVVLGTVTFASANAGASVTAASWGIANANDEWKYIAPTTQPTFTGAITKATGATVATTATKSSNTHNSVTVTAGALTAGTDQTLEYAVSTSNSTAPTAGWTSSTTITGLSASTTYYIWTRAAENTNYSAGAASVEAVSFTTSAATTTYTLTVNAGTGGTASGSASLAQGATTTITASSSGNYSFSHWTVSGAGSSVANANSASTTFTMGNANATATANFTYNPPYNPGDGGYTPAPDPKVPVIIDGKEYNIGKISTSGNTATVSVDQTELNKQIANAKESVIIPISSSSRTVVAQLVVKNIEDISAKDMTLSVKVGNIVYELPADSVDTKALMEQFATNDPAKVQLSISITKTVDTAAKDKVDAAVKNLGAEIVIPAIQFSIAATYNGTTVEVKIFDAYVPRTIEITAEQAAKITTAIVVEADGTTRHVPTRVYQKDGKWYAEINSRTNSTYVLIYNNKSFIDAKDKWYEKAVNEMVSRKIMLGVGNNNFAGDRAITRAEFATIVVNALGLPATGNGGVFTDVSKANIHYGAIGTAYEYSIVCGVGNNKYNPDANITWQEAMTMLCRASEIAGYKLTAGSYENYSDASNVSEWAKEFVSLYSGSGLFIHDGQLRSKENITRGETAVAVLTMLQKAKLIDVR